MAAISWSTIGKEDPLIRGKPSEFDGVASAFDNVKKQTRLLNDELRELRAGEAEGFRGEAANAFCNRIKSLSEALGDVPLVASSISGVFRSHSRDLSALRKEAGAALARAETGWNKKRHAESDISSCESRLRSISRQLSALSGDDSPGAASARSLLRSRRSSVRHDLGQARRRLDDANDRLDRSRSEWDSLRKDEDTLNEQTSKSLLNLELRSLEDPGFWESVRDKVVGTFVDIAEGIAAVWESIEAELLENIHQFLSDLLEIMDWAGLVLDFVPGVNLVYKAIEASVVIVKAAVGLGLVAKGAMSMAAWAADTALDAVGLVPGVPKALIKPLAKVGSKMAAPIVKQVSGGVERAAKGLNINTKRVANVVEGATSTVSRKIESMGNSLNKHVNTFFISQSLKSQSRRLRFARRRYQWLNPGSNFYFSPAARSSRDRVYRNAHSASDRILGMGTNVQRRIKEVSSSFARSLSDIGDLSDDIIDHDVDDIAAGLRSVISSGAGVYEDAYEASGLESIVDKIIDPKEKVVDTLDSWARTLDERSEPVKDGRRPVLEPCGL